jgi:hypothetical protein
MITGLVDHLWQSCCCSGVACAFSWLLRGNAAVVRLWLWRIAALKLVLPFSLLVALGGWLGFPTAHSADPTPPALVTAFRTVEPLFGPATYFELAGFAAATIATLALVAAAACGWWIVRQLQYAQLRAEEQARLREANPDDILPSIGFTKAALLTAFVLAGLTAPMLAGAITDHQWRRELLIANALALRNASATINPATRGLGTRYRVDADAHGVSIRNANIHDLVALAYGVNRYSVISPQMMSEAEPASRSWIHWPRYDVRIEAPVPDPSDFDPYALRQNLTKLLADRFGLEIYVNGDCQPPCGVYQMKMAADPL